jgi:hypothetical protein
MEIVRPTGWRKTLRIVLFVLFAGFMNFGPCYRQALGGRGDLPMGLQVDRRLFRQWVMFSGYGTDICDVRFSQVMPNGEQAPLDRFELLGHPVWSKAPRSVRRIKTADRAVYMGRQLCGILRREQSAPDVRIVARCGSKKGWRTKLKGHQNICEIPADRQGQKRKRK